MQRLCQRWREHGHLHHQIRQQLHHVITDADQYFRLAIWNRWIGHHRNARCRWCDPSDPSRLWRDRSDRFRAESWGANRPADDRGDIRCRAFRRTTDRVGWSISLTR